MGGTPAWSDTWRSEFPHTDTYERRAKVDHNHPCPRWLSATSQADHGAATRVGRYKARLAALVPQPRTNLVLYSGVLAPRANGHHDIVPTPSEMIPGDGATLCWDLLCHRLSGGGKGPLWLTQPPQQAGMGHQGRPHRRVLHIRVAVLLEGLLHHLGHPDEVDVADVR